jgi:hypothetical protein
MLLMIPARAGDLNPQANPRRYSTAIWYVRSIRLPPSPFSV